MNAQAILDKILEDAKENASAVLKDANDRAGAMRKATEERIATARANTEARAHEDAQAAAVRMGRMAELDERKLLLKDKRDMMERAFSLPLDKMKSMPAKEARAFLLSTLTELADGDEQLVVGAQSDGWMDASFLAQANAALTAAGKPGKLTLAKEKRPGVSGVILARHDTEIHCTYQALLDSRRLELEAQVAQTLFPES